MNDESRRAMAMVGGSRILSALGLALALALAPMPMPAVAASAAHEAARGAPAQQPYKIYISADMEGIAGVVTEEQLGPTGFEYARFREFMTNEVNAAISAARAVGVTEILVSDSHGNGQNLLIEKLPPDVQVVRSWPRPLMMMQGIDASFAGVLFIGYHSGTSNPEGVRAHTISSAKLTDLRLNGVAMPESGLNAAIAGSFGVPILFISGDDVCVKEAKALLGDVEGGIVKWALGFHSARTLTPDAACQVIKDGVTRALARGRDFAPYVVKAPVQLELAFKNYRPVEVLSYLSIVERISSHAIRFTGKDIVEVSKFIEFATTYQPDLSP